MNDLTVVLLFHAQTHHAETKNTTLMRKCSKCKYFPICQTSFTSRITNITERRLGGGQSVKLFSMLLKERNLLWGSHCGNDKDSILPEYDVMSIGQETFWGSFLPSYSGPKDRGLLSLLWNTCVYQFTQRHIRGYLNLQNLTESLAKTVTQLFTVVPRKHRNYNFTRNSSKRQLWQWSQISL